MVGRLFERFDRLDAEKRVPEAKGFGIGLNYAFKLAAEHKGELRYEPNDPRGSVFILEIPVNAGCYSGDELAVREVEQSISSSVEPVLSADNPLDRYTVLVAEDNQDVRAFLHGLLSEHYNVILATNGIEAEDMLRITLPDIVLSDVVMPGKTGDQLCEEIKAHQEWAHIPVILLTAKSDHQARLSGIKKGADAYVDKPFDPEQLLAMIQTMINNRKLIQSKVMDMAGGEIGGASELDALQLSDSELDFLRKVTDVMSANIDNESFGITELASALCVSYSSLYSRIKALTGNSRSTSASRRARPGPTADLHQLHIHLPDFYDGFLPEPGVADQRVHKRQAPEGGEGSVADFGGVREQVHIVSGAYHRRFHGEVAQARICELEIF